MDWQIENSGRKKDIDFRSLTASNGGCHKEAPYWVHFGAGNLFRAFQANVAQNLLNEGVLDRGIVVAEGYDYEIVEKMNRPHDDYSILVTLKADGSVEKTVVGSVAESLALDSENETDFGRLKEIFTTDSLQMASFTITEKGYSLVNGKGKHLQMSQRILWQDLRRQEVISEKYLHFYMQDTRQEKSQWQW